MKLGDRVGLPAARNWRTAAAELEQVAIVGIGRAVN